MPLWGWSVNKVLYLLVSLCFGLGFMQVTLYHYRQNFRHWSMWVPVAALPLLALNALWLFFTDSAALRSVFAGLLGLGVLAGLVGWYYHFSGVGDRVGGYKLNNFLMGPPTMLPLISATCVSLIGLVAVYWR